MKETKLYQLYKVLKGVTMCYLEVINKRNNLNKIIKLDIYTLIECIKIYRFYKRLKNFETKLRSVK